ncbi:class I SAM-dependent methyltransferase [Flavihumibacter sp. R14]|nr:class I SAM-dependent methyltransferase [Flavihumibacter soli]
MNTGEAYDKWAKTYDQVENKTRDLEKRAVRTILKDIDVPHILEIGCGTGKNTAWLAGHCQELTALDFSEGMLRRARQKISDAKVNFRQADITKPWAVKPADLICCSLVLEHIEDLDFIFRQAEVSLSAGGQFYICELHPFRQLRGSRARFEHEGDTHHLEYFVHHISDYLSVAIANGFTCSGLQEWFDEDNRNEIPRLVSYQFHKRSGTSQ